MRLAQHAERKIQRNKVSRAIALSQPGRCATRCCAEVEDPGGFEHQWLHTLEQPVARDRVHEVRRIEAVRRLIGAASNVSRIERWSVVLVLVHLLRR